MSRTPRAVTASARRRPTPARPGQSLACRRTRSRRKPRQPVQLPSLPPPGRTSSAAAWTSGREVGCPAPGPTWERPSHGRTLAPRRRALRARREASRSSARRPRCSSSGPDIRGSSRGGRRRLSAGPDRQPFGAVFLQLDVPRVTSLRSAASARLNKVPICPIPTPSACATSA